MYRNNCYFKLKKQLDELATKIKENYSGDSDLANRVSQIQTDLDTNYEKDAELKDRVDNLQLQGGEIDVNPATEDQVDDLFP